MTWQPIKTAPKDRAILGFWRNSRGVRVIEVIRWDALWGAFVTVPGIYPRFPTHWIPLPEPPGDEQ
jgi:hypothetical protein